MWNSHAGCLAVGVILLTALPAQATTQGIPLTNWDFEAMPGPIPWKVIAFDTVGAPLNNIPGWTLPGPGVEDYGHTHHPGPDAKGDSGVQGGGNPCGSYELILAMLDGVAYQTSAFNVVDVPTTQQYRLSFDAHNIFTCDDFAHAWDENTEGTQAQLTARMFYLDGSTRTTIGAPVVIDNVPSDLSFYTLDIGGGSSALTPAIGHLIGVEFDVTSSDLNPSVAHSWVGIDNVLLQINGTLDGDLDGDGDVDSADYAAVRDHQQQTCLHNVDGELTNDGLVDLNDFRAFKTYYETPTGAGSGALGFGAAVPEPSTAVLALTLLTAALSALRRR
jgi:hypothetical protein